MKESLKFLWVNLVHFIVYYDNKPNCCNSIVAIGHKDKELLIIRPEYADEEKEIVAAIRYVTMIDKYTLLYGDGFAIDTWDQKIRNFTEEKAAKHPVCEVKPGMSTDKYLLGYVCPDCGSEWEMTADCACNDHCPQCDAEITPLTVEDL